MSVKPGKYIHFEGNEYIVTGMATHSETFENMVVYHAPDNDEEIWICPVTSWNETVEQNGHKIKRFINADEIEQELPVGLHNHSNPDEKVELFLSLFTGREDVFAKRWENVKKVHLVMFQLVIASGRRFVLSRAEGKLNAAIVLNKILSHLTQVRSKGI